MTTANIGDFDRPVTAQIVRAAKDILTVASIMAAKDIIPDTETPTDWDAVIDNMHRDYAAKIANARKNLPKTQRAAAVAALKWERGLNLQALKDRRAVDRRNLRNANKQKRLMQTLTPQD